MEFDIERLTFLSEDEVQHIENTFGTPIFVYDQETLEKKARSLTGVRAPFGSTIRFAIKANPHKAILSLFDREGLSFDASSLFEVHRLRDAGIDGKKALLTSQQVLSVEEIQDFLKTGGSYTATSLRQLSLFAEAAPGAVVSVRINPGVGVGHSKRTVTGGEDSSFGIWHEYIPEVLDLAQKHNLTIERVHTHIGTGGDPEVWKDVAMHSIKLLNHFKDARIINLGGGFKVARMSSEKYIEANPVEILKAIGEELQKFKEETGREIHLELEPGTYLTAQAGVIVSRVDDIVDTGEKGNTFVKVNAGMNDILRPGMYGAQHPIVVVGGKEEGKSFVYVGHNCESGDILTPKPSDPESILPRRTATPEIHSLVVIEGTGAYCSAMNAEGYNSFPSSPEILRTEEGVFREISRKGTLEELSKREVL